MGLNHNLPLKRGTGGRMKPYRKISTIERKIEEELKDSVILTKKYGVTDGSVQAELRLRADSRINLRVDHLHYPKNLRRDGNPLWKEMLRIYRDIENAARIVDFCQDFFETINIKTKTGPIRRAEAKKQFEIEMGNRFLSDCRQAKKRTKKLTAQVAELQARQKELLPQLRRANSEYLAERKAEKAEIARKNTEAIASGKFWNATKEALKDYFKPPFEKNYLADVSERWRAALFIAMKSTGYKSYSGDWRHKLEPTGNGYLCGIDDNGDEWGHEVALEEWMGIDEHDNITLSGVGVIHAMAELFNVSVHKCTECTRQGDLLFCPEKIPEGTELYHEEKWEVFESHKIWSPGLYRNGNYFRSDQDIEVSHTSHDMIVLPAGSYRLYELQVADAD